MTTTATLTAYAADKSINRDYLGRMAKSLKIVAGETLAPSEWYEEERAAFDSTVIQPLLTLAEDDTKGPTVSRKEVEEIIKDSTWDLTDSDMKLFVYSRCLSRNINLYKDVQQWREWKDDIWRPQIYAPSLVLTQNETARLPLWLSSVHGNSTSTPNAV